ncbi:hypothetical protein [Microvirga massiliensis]|uniref:hypothetical protein n=1 Tax=Microvirga massiliensis TaxID=1033741 RepID=UPI000B19D476|nr:hypothetical protein [Microvirga massiliensis]
MFTIMRKAVLPAIAALAFSGTVASLPAPAEAQVYYRGYGGGYGWHRPVYGYGGPYGYRYAPAYRNGYYGRPYYGYGYPYYHHRRSNGGAVAAGLIGGLALGALAAQAARPAYAYPVRTRYRDCFVERRRVVTRGGRVVVRRVRTCY